MTDPARKTWVKVCGLTTRRDVEHAVAAGADAIGIVSYAGSPRYVPRERISALISGVPVLTVLLSVDRDPADVVGAAHEVGASAVQPYGKFAADAASLAIAAGLTVLRPMRAVPGIELPQDDGSIPLLDTPHDALFGGTGETFDWGLVAEVERDFVLAGGLGPENVADAIARLRPWGVDASSRLEAEPGKKDPGKVTAFIQEAKRR